jgi:hypothetical protein
MNEAVYQTGHTAMWVNVPHVLTHSCLCTCLPGMQRDNLLNKHCNLFPYVNNLKTKVLTNVSGLYRTILLYTHQIATLLLVHMATSLRWHDCTLMVLLLTKHINPLTLELNPSVQMLADAIFFTGDFASWTMHFVKICMKNQQIHQLFIQFTNYVW